MAARETGEMLYKIYRALTCSLTPLINLHLRWRRFRGLEHRRRWPERLGRPSLPRPPGQLFWFHAVSLGEGMATIPVVKCCVERRPDVTVLMTSTTTAASDVIKNLLPGNVIYQFAPVDTPAAVDAFLDYWKPNAIILIENELWPNLIMGAARNGIALGLLNARMSGKSFHNWSRSMLFPLASLILSKFSLIAPLSTTQAVRFQLLGAPPIVINFAGDLKYAVESLHVSGGAKRNFEDLHMLLHQRKVWMASSIHKGEEKVILGVHRVLKHRYPDIVTIIAPRHPQHGVEISSEFQKEGVSVALRSRHNGLVAGTNIYVVDTLVGELWEFYRLAPIAVIGGSFLPGSSGHNISEAAAAGCAILTGHYVGHFSHMVLQMQQLNPMSVMQVSGELLIDALNELFSDAQTLEARRRAAKEAHRALSNGVVDNVWNLLNIHVFR